MLTLMFSQLLSKKSLVRNGVFLEDDVSCYQLCDKREIEIGSLFMRIVLSKFLQKMTKE